MKGVYFCSFTLFLPLRTCYDPLIRAGQRSGTLAIDVIERPGLDAPTLDDIVKEVADRDDQ